ncbi:hypothetical protein [Burkholderia contaminans]|uniref:hypothetical protein n=1 Tax=Burkholderia contaminans TaxID=488447 RepID=UPI00115FE93D|nr:hypothetical protein [Burkholderia contaminans]
MASKSTKLHEYINSVIATLALVVGGASAYFSWQANEAKREALTMAAIPTGECAVQYSGGPKIGIVGLCWKVTIANQSEGRLSIVNQDLSNIVQGKPTFLGGQFDNLETVDGQRLSLPIMLDGGEARTIIVRAPTMVSEKVAPLVWKLLTAQEGEQKPRALKVGELLHALRQERTDVMGNTLDPLADGIDAWTYRNPISYADSVFKVVTARGTVSTVEMTEPERLPGEPRQ